MYKIPSVYKSAIDEKRLSVVFPYFVHPYHYYCLYQDYVSLFTTDVYIIKTGNPSVYLFVCLRDRELLLDRWQDLLHIWRKYIIKVREGPYLYFVTLDRRPRSPEGQ